MKVNLTIAVVLMNVFSCINSHNERKDDSNGIKIQKINKKIDDLEYTLRQRGFSIDTNFENFDETEKLDYIYKELFGYRFITDQMTKSNHRSNIIKLDSFYYGNMSLSGYNRYLTNKLVLNYNNKFQEIQINDNSMEYNYKLRPYKLGENKYNGFIIQGKDTYRFGYTFQVVK